MTDETISPLRRRMIEDMTIRKLGPKTQAGYIRTVKNFAAFLGHSPDRANAEDIRRPCEGATSPKISCSPVSRGDCPSC